MNDKIVGYEDRNTLDDAFRWIDGVPVGQEAISGKRRVLELLTRLIEAAEADQPPLPEGWVVLDMPPQGSRRVLWHEAGCLYVGPNGHEHLGDVGAFDRRDRLTPLRPTVTEADVEKAAMVINDDGILPRPAVMRAAFEAAGIEVSDR